MFLDHQKEAADMVEKYEMGNLGEKTRSSAARESKQGEELSSGMFFIVKLCEIFHRSFRRCFILHLDRLMLSRYTSRLMWNNNCAVIQGLD